MPRRDGHTPTRDRRKHQGHRVHKRTRLARALARRNNRRIRPWDPKRWHDWMHDQGMPVPMPEPSAVPRSDTPRPVEMARKNRPNPKEKPQKPKRPKGGSK